MSQSVDELKLMLNIADRELYRAECLVKCLEAKLLRIEPEEFDELMKRLEAAKSKQQRAAAIRFDVWCDLLDDEAAERRGVPHATDPGNREKS